MLPPEELEREVSESLSLLEQNLHAPLHHYSYPEGLEFCYSDGVISCLKRHKILCSPTALHGINHQGDDPFHLKRIFVT